MFLSLLDLLKTNKYAQFAATLLGGILLGVLFGHVSSVSTIDKQKHDYEQKISDIEQHHSKEVSDLKSSLTASQRALKSLKSETSIKIASLTKENEQLKIKTSRSTYKMVKPDGTIIEKEYDTSDTESNKQVVTEIKQEFDQKVQSIENKWKKVHEESVQSLKKEYDDKVEKIKQESKKDETDKETSKSGIFGWLGAVGLVGLFGAIPL